MTTAQTYTVLHSFQGFPTEGSNPEGGMVLLGNTLFGTTSGGVGDGTVFKVNTDGTGFTNLYVLNNETNGQQPVADLILSGTTLYGTARFGGSSGFGMIFRLNTDGTAFTNLHSFTGTSTDGERPLAGLVLSNNRLYGTTRLGGAAGEGTIFGVNIDGTGFTNLYSFLSSGVAANSPYSALVLSGSTLFGTASSGGNFGQGTIFKINTNGAGYANLYHFSDGGTPLAGLILSGSTLYGTTSAGGTAGKGSVFAVSTNGSGFTNLHSFTATSGSPATNSDGAVPRAVLVLSDGTLYGTASLGGKLGRGTIFAVATNGTDFTTLFNLSGSAGAFPFSSLVFSGNSLYGTAKDGGVGFGTAFKLSLPSPQLTIGLSGSDVVLSWPTNFPGYTLQSITNLASPATWLSNSTTPVIVNGQITVTNPHSGQERYYRLIR